MLSAGVLTSTSNCAVCLTFAKFSFGSRKHAIKPPSPPYFPALPLTPPLSLFSPPQVDRAVVEMLLTAGFSENACVRAAMATQGQDAEAAMNWLLMHMEDPDINDPLPPSAGAPAAGGASQLVCVGGWVWAITRTF